MQTVAAKTILIRNKSTDWFGCQYNMNLYRGCCHGCIYCDSRSDCYHVDSFDTVRAKEDALRILRDELSRRIRPGVIATGAMSDPYNPFEKKQQLTRHALSLIDAYNFGVAIATKSDLIVRDIDILQDIVRHSPVLCKITITTLDDALAAKIEPHVASPSRRINALAKLSKNGIFCGILLMPVLPYITDAPENITSIVTQAAHHGARFIFPAFGVTMRAGQREYFLNELEQSFPTMGYKQKYQRAFGTRYHCSSPKAKQLWELFCSTCNQYGILYKMQDIIAAYKQGYGSTQLSFL